jgi:hypothetical protein
MPTDGGRPDLYKQDENRVAYLDVAVPNEY